MRELAIAAVSIAIIASDIVWTVGIVWLTLFKDFSGWWWLMWVVISVGQTAFAYKTINAINDPKQKLETG